MLKVANCLEPCGKCGGAPTMLKGDVWTGLCRGCYEETQELLLLESNLLSGVVKVTEPRAWRMLFAAFDRGLWQTAHLDVVAEVYAVASILYYKHAVSPIADSQYDGLCAHLRNHYETVSRNFEWLDLHLLRSGSGYVTEMFPTVYHEWARGLA